MTTNSKNGQALKLETTQPKDTEKGVEMGKVISMAKPDPIAARLANIHKAHALSEKRKKLIDTQDELRNFETGLGERDEIVLDNHKGDSITIKKPEAVKKVLDLLKVEVENSILNTTTEILTASL